MELNSSVYATMPFVSMQLSYSTADIEKTLFFGPIASDVQLSQPLGNAQILVVHGEMLALEDADIPLPHVPLTPGSGIFRVVGLDALAP